MRVQSEKGIRVICYVYMLYDFLLNYIETFTFLNVFKYITTRTGLAFFTSLLIALLIGGPFIKLFSNRKIFNPICISIYFIFPCWAISFFISENVDMRENF